MESKECLSAEASAKEGKVKNEVLKILSRILYVLFIAANISISNVFQCSLEIVSVDLLNFILD